MRKQSNTTGTTSAKQTRKQKLEAVANAANNAAPAEQAFALALLAAQPEAEASEQPSPKQSASGERRARQAIQRETARRYYNGASVAAHQRDPASRDTYAARVSEPVQRIGKNGPSQRDDSGLALILANIADDGVSFDPCAFAFDVGILSRLASAQFVTLSGDAFTLTTTGAERARGIVNRAAKQA